MILEVCANSVTSAIAAQSGGARRIELCDNLREGGTTPSYGQIILARKSIVVNLFIMIRPRGGDFVYTDIEFDLMKIDVQTCIDAGCDGIVIGILNPDGDVDKPRCAEMVSLAKAAGLGVTFHRAFDMCRDQFEALEDIIEIGCERILTSGGKSTAMEGARNIALLVEKAGDRIEIMPGCGINEYNIADLVRYTGAKIFHTTAKHRINSVMAHRNDNILFGTIGDEYTIEQTDSERVRKIIELGNLDR